MALELLTLGANGEKRISFPRMIGYYTSDFRTPDTEAAVDYLSLICLNGDLPEPVGPAQLKICHDALRELVLTTREFTKLLGDVRADGTREKGAIEKRMRLIKLSDQDMFLNTITEQAAVQADDDGRAADAVLLYHLAEDYDTVVQILNKNLSSHIALDDGIPFQGLHAPNAAPGSSMSLASVDNPTQLAVNMLMVYKNNHIASKINARNREACGVLLQISEAKRQYEMGEWAACLSVCSSSPPPSLRPRN